jgi:hypothetical protein
MAPAFDWSHTKVTPHKYIVPLVPTPETGLTIIWSFPAVSSIRIPLDAKVSHSRWKAGEEALGLPNVEDAAQGEYCGTIVLLYSKFHTRITRITIP